MTQLRIKPGTLQFFSARRRQGRDICGLQVKLVPVNHSKAFPLSALPKDTPAHLHTIPFLILMSSRETVTTNF